MSCSSSPIFIPSCSLSPVNSASNTPYVITSPPPDSPTSNEMAFPHEQMIEHIAHLLNIEEEEVCRQFPTVPSLLPIDRSPPAPTTILTPDMYMSPPTLSYPVLNSNSTMNPTIPTVLPFQAPSHFLFLPLTFITACQLHPKQLLRPTPPTPPPLSLPLSKKLLPALLPPFRPWPWSCTNKLKLTH